MKKSNNEFDTSFLNDIKEFDDFNSDEVFSFDSSMTDDDQKNSAVENDEQPDLGMSDFEFPMDFGKDNSDGEDNNEEASVSDDNEFKSFDDLNTSTSDNSAMDDESVSNKTQDLLKSLNEHFNDSEVFNEKEEEPINEDLVAVQNDLESTVEDDTFAPQEEKINESIIEEDASDLFSDESDDEKDTNVVKYIEEPELDTNESIIDAGDNDSGLFSTESIEPKEEIESSEEPTEEKEETSDFFETEQPLPDVTEEVTEATEDNETTEPESDEGSVEEEKTEEEIKPEEETAEEKEEAPDFFTPDPIVPVPLEVETTPNVAVESEEKVEDPVEEEKSEEETQPEEETTETSEETSDFFGTESAVPDVTEEVAETETAEEAETPVSELAQPDGENVSTDTPDFFDIPGATPDVAVESEEKVEEPVEEEKTEEEAQPKEEVTEEKEDNIDSEFDEKLQQLEKDIDNVDIKDDNVSTDINGLFVKVNSNVKEASDIFLKNVEMKKKIDDRFEELKKLQSNIEKTKKSDYDEINSYKDKVIQELMARKDEIEERLNTLKDLQSTFEKEKEEFENYKRDEIMKLDDLKRESEATFESHKDELDKLETKLRKQKNALEEERRQLSLDQIQYESDKNELANNMLKFNQIVGTFTEGMDKLN